MERTLLMQLAQTALLLLDVVTTVLFVLFYKKYYEWNI